MLFVLASMILAICIVLLVSGDMFPQLNVSRRVSFQIYLLFTILSVSVINNPAKVGF